MLFFFYNPHQIRNQETTMNYKVIFDEYQVENVFNKK